MSVLSLVNVGARLKSCFRKRFGWPRLAAFLQGPWFAYGMLALLQLRVVWGMWSFRDLTSGDTSSYFIGAYRWFDTGLLNIAWSPLYSAFYGGLMYVTSDAYRVTTLHRLLIVFAASLLVLAVFRRLLPPAVAWLAAAWWTVLPINFNTLYEVHLFALLPYLIAWLVLLSYRGRWARGAALAVLTAATVLVRNETIVAVALLGAACAFWEWHGWRRSTNSERFHWRQLVLAYSVPLCVAFLAWLFVCTRSAQTYSEVQMALEGKHTLNMAQVFAFGYQQRHPDWTPSPWIAYHDLMVAHFGAERLSLSQMLVRNPRAVLEHFWWNWTLAPNGFQVLLFNATSGSVNPDYAAVCIHSGRAAALTALLLSCWLAGLVALVWDWRFWWEAWLQPRAWGWLGMFAVAAVAIPVITTQRPRPSYLFGLSVFIMAATAMCFWMITYRWRWSRPLSRCLPLAMVTLIILVPPYFQPMAGRSYRPLRELVGRLQSFDVAPAEGAVPLLGDYASELAAYVWKKRTVLNYDILRTSWPAGMRLEQLLAERQVDLLYLNESMLEHLESEHGQDGAAFVSALPPAGWRLLGHGDIPGDRWRYFHYEGP